MRRSPADSTNHSLATFGKLQHIPLNYWKVMFPLNPAYSPLFRSTGPQRE